jgi:lysozyme
VKVSAAGVRAVIREEGCVLRPYNDSAKNATIGVGHLLHRGPVTTADRVRWTGFTQQDATDLLRRDLARFERAVDAAVRVPLTQGEFDPLVSLAFNIGEGGFATSTVVRHLNGGRRRAAADAFLMWRHPPELLPRRKRERAAFLKAKAADPLEHLTAGERALVREYDRLQGRGGQVARERREYLRGKLLEQRKRVWHAAQRSGWSTHHRRERYRSLLARTRS